MPPPQWTEPTLGLQRQWGLDDTAIPPWFMVPSRGSKSLRLDFALGMQVHSVNPRLVAIAEEPFPAPGSRFFSFSGRLPGRPIRIEVRDPRTKALASVLEVSIKRRKTVTMNFFFVEDRAGNRTTRQPTILDGLIADLNSIYNDQTNVSFALGDGVEVKVDDHLHDVVYEGVDAKTKKPTGEGRLIDPRRWRELFVKMRLRDFNVFFVPTYEPVSTNRNALPYTDEDGRCVVEDGREPLEILLPHAVGRMLGCPFTTDFNHQQHLMFWDDTLRRTGDFIPKACANIMNP